MLMGWPVVLRTFYFTMVMLYTPAINYSQTNSRLPVCSEWWNSGILVQPILLCVQLYCCNIYMVWVDSLVGDCTVFSRLWGGLLFIRYS